MVPYWLSRSPTTRRPVPFFSGSEQNLHDASENPRLCLLARSNHDTKSIL
jgi:hypothetical protein